MRALLAIARASAWNRRATLALTIACVALSTFLLLGVERLRADLRDGFTSAISGTDLIVGPRGGSTELLLYSVFHIGSPTHNMAAGSVERLAALPGVAWVVPISLGDSHRGYPVVATTSGYFDRFRYGERRALRFADGTPFGDLFDAVVGAEGAARLDYQVGSSLTLAHGDGRLPGTEHADLSFRISGVLARTGTPVDRSVFIGLRAMAALHADWVGGIPMPGRRAAPALLRERDLAPRSVTAALVGLEKRSAVFSVQRAVTGDRTEALTAILPGVALDELWTVLGAAERALLAMSWLVALVSLAGMVSAVLAGLGERRRELAVLRAARAGPRHVCLLLSLEGGLVVVAGLLAGTIALWIAIASVGPSVAAHWGLVLRVAPLTRGQGVLLAALATAGLLASLLPGWRAYRLSLADGLSPRL